MLRRCLKAVAQLAVGAAALLAAAGLSACGADKPSGAAEARQPASALTTSTALPGTGRPPVTIGDKNFTEQFVLGELYSQALTAQGYAVLLNRNIGPTEVTMQALVSGRLDMYPEYLGTWNSAVAGYQRQFLSRGGAYRAAQRYAGAHGLRLLGATPFSSTDAVGVTRSYAAAHELRGLDDLPAVASTLTFGAPPQFEQSASGLPLLERLYGFAPASFKPLDVGAQYQALDQGAVQAAQVGTTDAQLTSGRYVLLRDPRHAFGWGNVVPIVSARVLNQEGPAFTATINRVSRLLSTAVMRRLNAAVDVSHQDPATVAKQFLQAHGLVPA